MVTEATTPTWVRQAEIRSWLEAIRKSQPGTRGDGTRIYVDQGSYEVPNPRPRPKVFASERALIEYVLGDVNLHGGEPVVFDWMTDDTSAFELLERSSPNLASSFLELFTIDRAFAINQLQSIGSSLLSDLWVLPRLKVRGPTDLGIEFDIIVGYRGIFSLACYLIADSARGFGDDLCRCKLDECGKWFLANKPPTGRPQRLYCGKPHMDQAHERGSTARARKSRAAKAVRARRPK
jgi:hypothetical protein